MRIEKINGTYGKSPVRFGINAPLRHFEDKLRLDEFERKKKKPSLFKRIISYFHKKNVEKSPVKQKSDKITQYTNKLSDENNELNRIGAFYDMILGNYITCGKLTDFKDYSDGFMENQKLLFKFENPNSDEPTQITVFDSKKDMKIKQEFLLPKGRSGEFTVIDYSDNKCKSRYIISDKKIKYCKEKEHASNITREYRRTERGFKFFKGRESEDKNSKDTIIEVIIGANQGDIYKEKEKDGTLQTYIRRKNSTIWEKQN